MSIEPSEYEFNPVYHTINHRFFVLYGIKIADHIDTVEKVSWRPQEGFDFIAKDTVALVAALKMAKFQNDSRERTFGIIPGVGYFAGLATHGDGYREQSAGAMLHCAVAKDVCNVHLDDTAFVLEGYNANAAQHIADDLIWQTGVVANVAKVSVPLASFLGRVHPVVPNLRQMKPLSAVGLQFDLYSRRSADERTVMKLTIDATHSCSDVTCGALSALHGRTIEGENKFMISFTVIGL